MVVEWVCLSPSMIRSAPMQSPLVIDVETTSPDTSTPTLAKNPHRAVLQEIFLYSDAAPGVAYVVDVKHLQLLKERLYSEYTKDFILVGQNFKYDLIVLSRHGLDLTHFYFDDVIHYDHLDNENHMSHALAKILKREFEVEYKDDFWELYKSYLDAPEDVRHRYGANDAYWTAQAYKRLYDRYTASERTRKEIVTESLKYGDFGDTP